MSKLSSELLDKAVDDILAFSAGAQFSAVQFQYNQ
jgi:hypothetical protein